jgi:hypothetical protein
VLTSCVLCRPCLRRLGGSRYGRARNDSALALGYGILRMLGSPVWLLIMGIVVN